MSAKLRARAEAFLARPVPKGIQYVPDSIAERFLRAYATDGRLDLDAESADLLAICVAEAREAARTRRRAEAAYFRETAEILEAIQAELDR